jgi:hypothetical protein
MGALMKQAMASPAIAPFKKDAPKYAQKLAKAAHSLSAEALKLHGIEAFSCERAHSRARDGQVWLPDVTVRERRQWLAEAGRPMIYIGKTSKLDICMDDLQISRDFMKRLKG